MTGGDSWYDVLGVAPDATDDEIREAWREKTAAGPATPGFARFNDAAGVLLDPKRRHDYDLAQVAPTPRVPAASGGRARPLAVAVLAVLVICLIAGAVVAQNQASQNSADAAARTEALVQVNAAIPAMSYDYSASTTPQLAAGRYMTPSYRTKYEQLVNYGVKLPSGDVGQLVSQKVSASFAVKDAAVLNVNSAATEVSVLAYVDETEQKAGQPVTACGSAGVCQNRVVVTLVKTGDQWLIDNLKPF